MTTPGKTLAWFVVWTCGCSDVRVDQGDLPDTCPGHGRDPIAQPEQLEALTVYVGQHECWINEAHPRCPEVVAS